MLNILHVNGNVVFALKETLGGVDQVDTVAFEAVWSNIKDKYVSEVNNLLI